MQLPEQPPAALQPETLPAPLAGAETQPYDVRACGMQVLEALAGRAQSAEAAPALCEVATRKIPVSLMVREGRTTESERALSLMTDDGLTVHEVPTRPHAVPQDPRSEHGFRAEGQPSGPQQGPWTEFRAHASSCGADEVSAAQPFRDTGPRRVRQNTSAHRVPYPVASVSATHDTAPATDCSVLRPTRGRDELATARDKAKG